MSHNGSHFVIPLRADRPYKVGVIFPIPARDHGDIFQYTTARGFDVTHVAQLFN